MEKCENKNCPFNNLDCRFGCSIMNKTGESYYKICKTKKPQHVYIIAEISDIPFLLGGIFSSLESAKEAIENFPEDEPIFKSNESYSEQIAVLKWEKGKVTENFDEVFSCERCIHTNPKTLDSYWQFIAN